MMDFKKDFDRFVVSREQMDCQLPSIRRDLIAKACKQVAELTERNAEQALIVELERRLADAERKRDDLIAALDKTREIMLDYGIPPRLILEIDELAAKGEER